MKTTISSQIADLLRLAASLLNPGGRLLPSGPHHPRDRPFGPDIRHIGLSTGLGLVAAFDAARPVAGTARSALARKVRYLVRDLIEAFIGRLYFGSVVPLDPNITVVPGNARET